MKRFSSYRIALCLLTALIGANVYADNNSFRSRLGIDVSFLKLNPQKRIGWLSGLRWAHYVGTSQVNVGLAVFFGAPIGGNPVDERVVFGGGTLAYDGHLSRNTIYDIGLLLGYGNSKISVLIPTIQETSFFVVQPSLGIGWLLGLGWRFQFVLSYAHMTDAPAFSGPTFGFRFDYKSQTTVRDLND